MIESGETSKINSTCITETIYRVNHKMPGLTLIQLIKGLLNASGKGLGTVGEAINPCPGGSGVPHFKHNSIDFYLETLLDWKRTL